MMNMIILVCMVVCLSIIAAGFLLSPYPNEGLFYRLREGIKVQSIFENPGLNKFLSFLVDNKKGKLVAFSSYCIKKSDSTIALSRLYFLKIISLFVIVALYLMVKETNLEVLKTSIIVKGGNGLSIFQDSKKNDFNYNLSLYYSILKRVGEENINRLSTNEKLVAVKKVMPDILQTSDRVIIEEKAQIFVGTFFRVQQIRLLYWDLVLVIGFSFFAPDFFLLARGLFLINIYKKEILKLQNVFELLGNIPNFKSVTLLEEMRDSSKAYKKHFDKCLAVYRSDKDLGLDILKNSVSNRNFQKLVDQLRIYAKISKPVAMENLKRLKNSKENQMLITADENVNFVDILAFTSILPILWEVANLLLRPLLDMIYEAFKYV